MKKGYDACPRCEKPKAKASEFCRSCWVATRREGDPEVHCVVCDVFIVRGITESRGAYLARRACSKRCSALIPGRQPVAARFWSKVDKSPACWLWTAGLNRDGYGRFWAADEGGLMLAHRYAYRLLVGPIPGGLTIDHLCRTPRCVNPEHMEPVTNLENIRRATADRREAA